MILLKKPEMQGAEISLKLKELSQSTLSVSGFQFLCNAADGVFQRNHLIEFLVLSL